MLKLILAFVSGSVIVKKTIAIKLNPAYKYQVPYLKIFFLKNVNVRKNYFNSWIRYKKVSETVKFKAQLKLVEMLTPWLRNHRG